MYPCGSLSSNLVAFCGTLRRDHGFHVGPGDACDAARALDIVDLANERAVRDALRPVLSKTLQQSALFDRAFDAFFFPGSRGIRQPRLQSIERWSGTSRGRGSELRRADDQGTDERDGASSEIVSTLATSDADEGVASCTMRARYSPGHSDANGARPALAPVDAAWRDAARALVQHLELGLSRRWRPSRAGRRFDLRRTLRVSLHTGGEAIVAKWLRRPRRTPRFVMLIDGSRSMGSAAATALQTAVALASVTTRIEVFAFSTALHRVTNDVRRAAAGRSVPLTAVPRSWAGGTAIGRCLREFLRRFGERLVGRDTVVVIASDGLDVGATGVLRDAMRELHRRSAGVVWVNPLLGTAGYEPTASGMRAARPYITTFVNVDDAAGLRQLSRAVRVRPR